MTIIKPIFFKMEFVLRNIPDAP